ENLVYQKMSVAPPRPSDIRRDLSIPRPLEDVIMKCLEKRPEDRFTDMADLEAALCEAQIAMGVQTLWDDLPLPDLPDAERRDRILARMPSPLDLGSAQRLSWLWPIVAAVSSLASVSLAVLLAF